MCTYPRFIAGRGDTGQQTDIVMSVEGANAYVQTVRSPRSLFLEHAKLLNNRSLTHMSDEALAALVYAQVYVEEKWFKDYNWVHPYWNSNRDPQGGSWLNPNSLNAKRYAPVFLGALNGWAGDVTRHTYPYRLQGFGYGPANALVGQAYDAAQWYLAYMNLSENRYGLMPRRVFFPQNSALAASASSDVLILLQNELMEVDQSQFWNTLRFVWAAARHREGAYPDNRSYQEKERYAIDYSQLLGTPPGGRPPGDISAFALMTTVYTDAITVSAVTGYDTTYTGRDNRSIQDWRRFVSERNKAIRNVELLSSTNVEGLYRIQQGLAIGPFKTQYEDPTDGDFLPYSREEVEKLVQALLFERENSEDAWVSNEAKQILDTSQLLQEGYQYYTLYGRQVKE